jgi:hypothetical protein
LSLANPLVDRHGLDVVRVGQDTEAGTRIPVDDDETGEHATGDGAGLAGAADEFAGCLEHCLALFIEVAALSPAPLISVLLLPIVGAQADQCQPFT